MKNNDWLDNHSWIPELLIESRPIEEPVEPGIIERATGVHVDPVPGTIDWLYQDHGGES
jgi:hypothetical protein